jgi:hypothetical protein
MGVVDNERNNRKFDFIIFFFYSIYRNRKKIKRNIGDIPWKLQRYILID